MLQSSVSWLGGLAIKQRNKMSPPENQQPNAHVRANLSHCNLIYVCMHLDLDSSTALRAFLIWLVSRAFSGMWVGAWGVAGLRVGARRICARIWVTSEPSTCFFSIKCRRFINVQLELLHVVPCTFLTRGHGCKQGTTTLLGVNQA